MSASEPPPLHVLHVIKGLGRGGAEKLLPTTLAYHDRRGFAFSCAYLLPWKGALVGALQELGVVCHCLELRTRASIVLAGAHRLFRLLQKLRPQVVHAHLPLAGFIARLACSRARVPLVYTEHNVQESYHPLTRWLQRLTWSRQALVVAVSQQVADSARERHGVSVPIRVIANGVPVEALSWTPVLRQQGREALGLAEGSPVVGTVAVFRKVKRLDRWLRVAAAVLRCVPEARFLLVGDGPQRAPVEGLARQLGIADRVIFAGLVADPKPLVAAMDVFFVSSDFEGLPVAVLEAMALERPVVATRVGGVPEAVVPGVTGFLHQPEDLEGMASSVVKLLREPGLRRAFGEAARRRVELHFSARRMQAQLEAVYRRVAGGTEHGYRR